VDIRASFIGSGGVVPLVNRVEENRDLLGFPGAFTDQEQTTIFVAGIALPLPPEIPTTFTVKRNAIDAISVNIAPVNCDVAIQYIKITARDTGGGDEMILDQNYRAAVPVHLVRRLVRRAAC
jgi:hypothetical protein